MLQEIGLKTAYRKKRTVYQTSKKFMALAYLPPEEIKDAYGRICRDISDPLLDVSYSTSLLKTRGYPEMCH